MHFFLIIFNTLKAAKDATESVSESPTDIEDIEKFPVNKRLKRKNNTSIQS